MTAHDGGRDDAPTTHGSTDPYEHPGILGVRTTTLEAGQEFCIRYADVRELARAGFLFDVSNYDGAWAYVHIAGHEDDDDVGVAEATDEDVKQAAERHRLADAKPATQPKTDGGLSGKKLQDAARKLKDRYRGSLE